MKLIGLLGGTSWPSTIDYYRLLNEMAQARFGGEHSANLLLKSIDYHSIKSRYATAWQEIPPLLKKELRALIALKPDCILLCNNTLHKALDQIMPELDTYIPFFHIADITARHLRERNQRNILLLATKLTMEDGYYAGRLEAEGATVTLPTPEERIRVQEAQTRLAHNEHRPEDRAFFRNLLKRYSHLDAAVLACTELPLVITQEESALPLVNPAALQCAAAFDYATQASDFGIHPYRPEWREQIKQLIISTQHEFGVPITLADQPDLDNIPAVYQQGNGNFWVAVENNEVIGTVALIDRGQGTGILRKMFVRHDRRGALHGVAQALLDALLAWSREKNTHDIYLGTGDFFASAQYFYRKNGFQLIADESLPPHVQSVRMKVDNCHYHRRLAA